MATDNKKNKKYSEYTGQAGNQAKPSIQKYRAAGTGKEQEYRQQNNSQKKNNTAVAGPKNEPAFDMGKYFDLVKATMNSGANGQKRNAPAFDTLARSQESSKMDEVRKVYYNQMLQDYYQNAPKEGQERMKAITDRGGWETLSPKEIDAMTDENAWKYGDDVTLWAYLTDPSVKQSKKNAYLNQLTDVQAATESGVFDTPEYLLGGKQSYISDEYLTHLKGILPGLIDEEAGKVDASKAEQERIHGQRQAAMELLAGADEQNMSVMRRPTSINGLIGMIAGISSMPGNPQNNYYRIAVAKSGSEGNFGKALEQLVAFDNALNGSDYTVETIWAMNEEEKNREIQRLAEQYSAYANPNTIPQIPETYDPYPYDAVLELVANEEESRMKLTPYLETMMEDPNVYQMSDYIAGDDLTYDADWMASYLNDSINNGIGKADAEIINPYEVLAVEEVGDYYQYYQSTPYDLMTEAERAVFNYYYNAGEYETAKKYAKDMAATLQQRERALDRADWEFLATDNAFTGALMWTGAVVSNVAGAVTSPLDMAAGLLGVEQANPNLFADFTSTTRTAQENALGELGGLEVLKKNIPQWAYSTGTSIADMGVAAGLGGSTNAALGLMGLEAAASDFYGTKDSEMKPLERTLRAAASGGMELLTEAIPMDEIMNAIAKPGHIMRSVFSEAVEEGVSEIGGVGIDEIAALAFNHQSEVKERYNHLKLMGEEDPEGTVMRELATNIAASMLGGGLAGLGMGSAGSAKNYANNREAGKAIQRNAGTEKLVKIGKEMGEGTEAYTLAEKIEKQEAGKKSNAELGKLYQTILKDKREQYEEEYRKVKIETEDGVDKIEKEIGNIYGLMNPDLQNEFKNDMSKYKIKGIREIAEEIVRADGKRENLSEGIKKIEEEWGIVYQPRINYEMRRMKAKEVEQRYKEIKEIEATRSDSVLEKEASTETGKRVKELTRSRGLKETKSMGIIMADADGTQVEIKRVNRDGKGIKLIVEAAEGEKEVNLDEVKTIKGTNVARVIAYAERRPEIAAEEVNAMLHLTEETEIESEKVIDAYEAGVNAGYAGNERTEIRSIAYGMKPKDVETLKQIAGMGFETGKAEQEAAEEARMKKVRTRNRQQSLGTEARVIYVGEMSGVEDAEGRGIKLPVKQIRGELNAQQNAAVDVLSKISKAVGVNIAFYRSKAEEGQEIETPNGWYDDAKRTIYLDLNAGVQGSGEAAVEYTIMQTAAHELTHFIESGAGAEYENFRQIVRETLEAKGQEYMQLVLDKARENRMSRAQAETEVIADAAELMLKDTTAISELAKKDRTLFRKIQQFVTNFARKIRRAIGSFVPTMKESAMLIEMRDGVVKYVDGLQEAWDRALIEAAGRKEAGPRIKVTRSSGVQEGITPAAVDVEVRGVETREKTREKVRKQALELLKTGESEGITEPMTKAVADEIADAAAEAAEKQGANLARRLGADGLNEMAQNGTEKIAGKYGENIRTVAYGAILFGADKMHNKQGGREAAEDAVREIAAFGGITQEESEGLAAEVEAILNEGAANVTWGQEDTGDAEAEMLQGATEAAMQVASDAYDGEIDEIRKSMKTLAETAAKTAVEETLFGQAVDSAMIREETRKKQREGATEQEKQDNALNVSYSRRRASVPSFRQTMVDMQETPDMTETEKSLLKKYKEDIAEYERLQSEINSQVETIRGNTNKDEVTKANNRMRVLRVQQNRVEDRLYNAEKRGGFAKLMNQYRSSVQAYMMGKNVEEAGKNIAERIRSVEDELKKLRDEQRRTNNRKAEIADGLLIDATKMKKKVAEIRKEWDTKMSSEEIRGRIVLYHATMLADKKNGGNEAAKILKEFVRDMTDKTNVLTEAGQQTIDMIKEHINSTILIDSETADEIRSTVGSISEYRRVVGSVIKKVRLAKKDETGNVDLMAENAPDWAKNAIFGESINEKDMALKLYDTIKKAKMHESMYAGEEGETRLTAEMARLMKMVEGIELNIGEVTEAVLTKALDDLWQARKTAYLLNKETTAKEIVKYYEQINRQSELMEERKSLQQANEMLQTTVKNWYEERDLMEERRKLHGFIRKQMQWMDKRIRNETDQKRIPEGLKPVVEEAVRIFAEANDVIKVFPEKQAEYIKSVYGWLKTVHGTDLHQMDELLKEDLEDALHQLKSKIDLYAKELGKKAGKETKEEKLGKMRLQVDVLKDISEIVKEIRHAVGEADNILIDGQRQKIEYVAQHMSEQLQKKEDYSVKTGAAGAISEGARKLLKSGNITPIYFFDELGTEVMTELNQDLLDAQSRHAMLFEAAKEKIESIQKETNYWSWKNRVPLTMTTWQGGVQKDAGNHTITLTVDEAMSVWATWRREHVGRTPILSSSHLEKGGFTLKNGKRTEGSRVYSDKVPHKINEKDIAVIDAYLTEEMKQYALKMIDYMSHDLAELGNEVSMQLFGIKKFTEEAYFPMKVKREQLAESSNAGTRREDGSNRIAGMASSKRRVDQATKPLEISGFTEVATEHINQMLMYGTFAIPIENFNKVLNQPVYLGEIKEGVEIEGDASSRMTLRGLFEQKFGTDALNYLRTYLKDVNGGPAMDMRDRGPWKKMVTAFKRNAVMASASVAIQQPWAAIRAMNMVNPKYFVPIKNKIDSIKMSEEWEQLTQYSGVALIKERGGFDMTSGKSLASQLEGSSGETYGVWKTLKDAVEAVKHKKEGERATRIKEAQNAISEKMDDIMVKMPEAADKVTWAYIWRAIKAETAENNPGMDINGDEFLQKAAKRFEDVINRTQVYDSTLVRSPWMRSKSGITQMITSFMAEPTLTANMLMNGIKKSSWKNPKPLLRATTVWMAGAVVNAMAKAMVTAGRDDDEEKPWLEKYLSAVEASLFGLGGELNPLNLFPWVSDAISILEGYDVSRSDMDVFETLVKETRKAASGKYDDEPWKGIENVGGAYAAMIGIPLKNIMRDARTGINTVKHIFGDQREINALAMMDDLSENMWTLRDRDNGWYSKELYKAMEEGDKKREADIKEYLEKVEGKEAGQIEEMVRSIGKTKLLNGEKTKDEMMAFLLGNGMAEDQKEAFRYVDRWEETEEHKGEEGYSYSQYNTMHDAIAAKNGKEVNEAVKELKKNGFLTEKGTIKTTLRNRYESQFKELFEKNKKEFAELQSLLVIAMVADGYKREDALEYLKGWLKE